MFHFRGLDFEGLVCGKCKALWTNPDKRTIFDAAEEIARHPDGPGGFCGSCKKATIHTCSTCAIGFPLDPVKWPRRIVHYTTWLCGAEECVKAHGHEAAA
jgi:hypothetical protein